MRTSTVGSWSAVMVMVPMLLAAWAGGKFLGSDYGTQTVRLSETVAFEYTNGPERVLLGSIMVKADAASNAWTILLINNNFTNILKTGTLTSSSNTLLYEGYGTVPLGGGARLRFTGTVNTNGAATTNAVQWSVHTFKAMGE